MVWSGTWVAERLGVALEGDERLSELLGLALRRNPKRAHLLVSNVLGKHVPQSPSVVYDAGFALGERVRALLGDAEAARAVVLGYAETATGLGHSVADGVGLAPYLHSTRRPVEGVAQAGGFEESHSHATSHLLLPEDPRLLAGDGTLVLVDDEFSTGNTVLNTIRALHERYPRKRYVVVALVDMRSPADVARMEALAGELTAQIDLIALARGTVRLPAGVLEKGQRLVAQQEATSAPTVGALSEVPEAPAPAGSAGAGAVVQAVGPADGPGAPGAVAATAVPADGPADVPGGPAISGSSRAAGVAPTAVPADVPGAPAVSGSSRAAGVAPTAVPADGPGGPGAGEGSARVGGPAGGREAVVAAGGCVRVALGWPGGVPDGGRHGFTPAHRAALEAALPGMAARIADALCAPDAPHAERVLVLGFEELMYAPLRLARALEDAGAAPEVRYSTTTRSPVLAVDDPGYAIRSRIVFPAHDAPADGPGERYAYNVAGAGFDAIVAVVDSAADTPELHAPDGLLAQLAAHAPRVVLAVVPTYVPAHAPQRQEPSMPEPLRGPAFSSYAPDEVGWLLQDLSDVELEAPTEEREEAIQAGGAHYAESLPVEYQPTAAYQELFHDALDASAARIARAVGAVTETVLAERSPHPVLVSLARAGTPVGVLMRRWAQYRYGLDLPHYAVSIVRGRGIDTNAMRWLAAHHDPADVVFVDGWTGKGAITRELADALAEFEGFDPEIAVLADPGGCVRTYGTREDFLIPSACLNSTVSGLISRTVLRADLVGPDDFHGAKFYRELAGADVSGHFLDTVAARFDEVADAVDADVKELLAADRAPTWEGWAAVERISEEYGIHDVNLVKPGVGETTRVLLRRVPWRILAKRGAGGDLDHVRLLAEQRGVPVEEVDELPYTCVGLIHPQYTRGATGADGKAVAAK
ncbi:phosphoribosyltransferase domain-containing protein [Streptomyces sp. A3M-1-3]|nr:phosphoribosyltransferase domain-containing protein [Streptomyces sp. A3M-1-3]MCP3821179.1 phosphoribosyltransferase domain-containing protein [Streptomyces sp. A3M-1-3]